MVMDSGSIDIEINKRLGVLHKQHHNWLMACAYNKSKNKKLSEDLVQDLYLYLAEKRNTKLFFNESFNLLYCYNFLSSRFINYIKRENKTIHYDYWPETKDDVYNIDEDKRLEDSYDALKKQLNELSKTKMWTSARLYELYAFNDVTMEELSKEIGISKSTVFLNVKKIKLHLKKMLDNPFNDKDLKNDS